MHSLLRSNPLLDQTRRFDSSPSLRAALVLLAALLTGTMVGRGWLINHLPIEARAVLLFLVWLLPPVTMAMATASTVRRLDDGSVLLARQPPLTDGQVIWGLGLSTLYTMRVVLALSFGLLPALVDDTLVGCALMVLCMVGLHLAGSMLGTVLALCCDRQRWGKVMHATMGYPFFLSSATDPWYVPQTLQNPWLPTAHHESSSPLPAFNQHGSPASSSLTLGCFAPRLGSVWPIGDGSRRRVANLERLGSEPHPLAGHEGR
jgi:hypothetical protein